MLALSVDTQPLPTLPFPSMYAGTHTVSTCTPRLLLLRQASRTPPAGDAQVRREKQTHADAVLPSVDSGVWMDGRLKATTDSGCASLNSVQVLRAAKTQHMALVQRIGATEQFLLLNSGPPALQMSLKTSDSLTSTPCLNLLEQLVFLSQPERVTGRKARGLQMEEVGCKRQTGFLSLLSSRRKQTSVILFPLLDTNLKRGFS